MIRPLLWLPLAALCASPALGQDASLEKRAQKLHAMSGGTYCEPVEGGYVPEDAYMAWDLTYKPSWSEDAEEETVTVIRIFCGAGAYNIQHSYYINRSYEGLTPLSFATPSFETKYAEPDNSDSDLESLTVTGFGSTAILVNSEFDPESGTITSNSYWRGIGDASSSGTWVFKEGEFNLVKYDIDASYDGEINPETVVDYTYP
ncbi:MAG: DUF1176 domain-containing protein [Devosia sp.]|uniref:DUF1176 domain-containing protein n=1 Tax=Devosia sp. TaxID=1871048 RepID=UPI0024C73C44|nr:DUF1176 domain-containing protein [Devosia sp.]UYO00270.1 MAG: DUF1176 domain-containing protein [Devosia sp.]